MAHNTDDLLDGDLKAALERAQAKMRALDRTSELVQIREAEAKWASCYGVPYPASIHDLMHLAVRVGYSADRVYEIERAGDLLPAIEGHLARLRDHAALSSGPEAEASGAGASEWVTVTEAGKMLVTDVSGITLDQAKARVSKAATAKKFITNGKKGQGRLIDLGSFTIWRMEQREKDLAAYDSNL